MISDILRIKRKNKYLGNSDYDLIHFHGISFCNNFMRVDELLGRLFLLKIINFNSINIPKILTMHDIASPFFDNKIFEMYEHHIIDQFENIICVDKVIEGFVLNYLNSTKQDKKVWFIPNSIDIEKFRFSELKFTKKLKIGFVGNVEYLRGMSFLYQLMENLPDFCELHIVSPIKPEKIKPNVHIYGSLPPHRISEILKGIDVLFNPLIQECITRIALEAMSCGRPVIMFDIGDRYPVIHCKTGYLLKKDINEVFSLLEYINDNKEELRKLGKNARRIVEEEFSNEVMIPKIKKIYENLIK